MVDVGEHLGGGVDGALALIVVRGCDGVRGGAEAVQVPQERGKGELREGAVVVVGDEDQVPGGIGTPRGALEGLQGLPAEGMVPDGPQGGAVEEEAEAG